MGVVELALLILLVVVCVFGLGVVLLNRRGRGELPPPRRSMEPGAERSTTKSGTILEERAKAGPDTGGLVAEAAELDTEQPTLEPVVVEPEPSPGTLRERLAKARSAFSGAISGVLGRSGITDESFDDLEDALLRADVGVAITDELLDGLRARVKGKEIVEPGALLDALQEEMTGRLRGSDRSLSLGEPVDGAPTVWMFVGVNGVGKTTTIGKLANQ